MFTHLPEIVHGIDIAATSSTSKAFPVGISIVTFDVATLSVFGCITVFSDTNDEKAKRVFEFSEDTQGWWEGKRQNSPPKLAYDLTFNAEFKNLIPDSLNQISDYLGGWKKLNSTIASKTPVFDVAILQEASKMCNVHIPTLGYHTLIDNAHMALRSLIFAGFEPNLEKESFAWTKGRNIIEHFAPHEAGEAGYVTARHYHLLHLKKIDPELATEAASLMVEGKYSYAEFSVKHKDKLIKGA